MKPFSAKKMPILVLMIVLGLLSSPLGVIPARAAGVLYVMPGGTGDCSSWASACGLQTALAAAVSGDEIWVAAGVYKPTTNPTDRGATFQLKDGVAVYGGFAGAETVRDQRNFEINTTILSGDIDNNDSQTPIITDITTVTGNATNSYRVVIGITGATLDGFTVTAGGGIYNYVSNPVLANLIIRGNWSSPGGGMYNDKSSPQLMNVTFRGNLAQSVGGGGMSNRNSNPQLTNVVFDENLAPSSRGGGMYNENSNPQLNNVTFQGNSANIGGGMYNDKSNLIIENVTFYANSSLLDGGGIYNIRSSLVLTNVTFSANMAGANSRGGGMLNGSGSNPMLTNVTFSGNQAGDYGGGMYNYFGNSPQIRNAIFWGNIARYGAQIDSAVDASLIISDSVVQGGCPAGSTCSNILTADPMLGPIGNHGGFTPTIRLLTGSSAIDAGNADICPATDQRGSARPHGAGCDMGAYEYTDAIILVDTHIDTHPDPISHIAEAGFSFSGSSYLGGTVTFECSLDGGVFAACSSPQSYSGLAHGWHTFMVRATDSFGNVDNGPAAFTWKVSIDEVILYVKPVASGTGDCSSWANACDLQTALAAAVSGDEIWVAAGTYLPHASENCISFELKNGVALYGGFAGAETTRDQRDYAANPTILSGDLNGDDNDNIKYYEETRWENSYRVVLSSNVDGTSVLDGFTISGGNAGYDGIRTPCIDHISGGGIYNQTSHPTLANLIIEKNTAFNEGGGIFNDQSSPTLTNVIIQNNAVESYGAGIFNRNNSNPSLSGVIIRDNISDWLGGGIINLENSNPSLSNVVIAANSAVEGGGMFNDSSNPILANVVFRENSTSLGGAGIYNFNSNPLLTNVTFEQNFTDGYGGGMMNHESNPVLLNVTFSANVANAPSGGSGVNGEGGGMHNYVSNPLLINVTMTGNDGGGLNNMDSLSLPTLKNVIIANSLNGVDCGSNEGEGIGSLNPASSHNLIGDPDNACGLENGVNGNIVGVDPRLDSLADNGGFTQTHALLAGSPAINAGTCLDAPTTDQRGVARPQGAGCDIGAYEAILSDHTVTFDANGGQGVMSSQTASVSTPLTLNTFTRAGFAFSSWNTSANGSGAAYADGASYNFAEDITLYAQWMPLTSPSKIAPAANSSGVALAPTLSWNPLAGATGYEYCYSSAPGPCARWNSVGTDTSVTLSGLAPNYTYAWQVRAITSSGAVEADNGVWWSFSTTNTPSNTWPPYTPPGSATFADVPATHWAWDSIERFYSAGITGGCSASPLSYCPEQSVTRAQMAIFLLRGIHGSAYTPPSVGGSTGFSDVPVSYWASAWIKQFYAEGITGGCGSGVYCPDQSVTRAQMAIFLLRAKHGSSYSPPDVDGSTGFGDVAADYWAAAWVKQLAAEGITSGCGNGNYCPEEPVTRAQMAVFLVRAFGLP